eukprot:gene27018-33235_t
MCSSGGEEQEEQEEHEEEGLSAVETAVLKEFLNPSYLTAQALEAIADRFDEDGSVQLQQFLKPQLAKQLSAAADQSDEVAELGQGRPPAYEAGTAVAGWEPRGPPVKQRYLAFPGVADDSIG